MARREAARAFVQVRRHMACAAREEDKGGVWGGRGKVSGVNSLVRGEASTLTPEQTCADKQTLRIRRRGRGLEGPEGAGR